MLKTYFVYNKDKDVDYIVVPEKTVLVATPKTFADFLYAGDFSQHESELQPGQPEDFGEVVAILENDHLRIMNPELWSARRESMEW
ncbi:MAG: hypothetical protein ACOCY5_01985 [Desulfohalobiaceae bacterium]